MAEYINIAPREHVEKRITMDAKPGDAYSESTGRKETTKYTGTWADMLAQATDLIGGGGGSMQVTCELERLEGGIGELTVTIEEYEVPESPPDDGDDEPLGSVENPEITCSYTVQAEPLLGHPAFASVNRAQAWLLQQVAAGTHPDAHIEYNGKKYVLREACDQLSGAAEKALRFYLKGITQYYEVFCEVTARSTEGELSGTPGKISVPPGNVETPEGRNWLCTGKGKTVRGDEVEYTATYRMSGAGGWNQELYS